MNPEDVHSWARDWAECQRHRSVGTGRAGGQTACPGRARALASHHGRLKAMGAVRKVWDVFPSLETVKPLYKNESQRKRVTDQKQRVPHEEN